MVEAFLIAVVIVSLLAALGRGKAKNAYEKGLDRLRTDPGNFDLRLEVLRLGLAHYKSSPEAMGTASFDKDADWKQVWKELAEIPAPQGALLSSKTPAPLLPSGDEVEARLAKLDSLKSRGLISEAEYASKRSKVLDEL